MENTVDNPQSEDTFIENSLSKEQILNWYMTDVLEGNLPKNVFLFSKNHGIQENDFYIFFNSFESIEKYFFVLVFEKTFETLKNSDQYPGYPGKEKLLSFYYTFFGNLTVNRSFVLYLLKPVKLENLKKLSGLQKRFMEYIGSLEIEKPDLRQKDLKKLQDRALEAGAWTQFLVILRFWLGDESIGFEKTDIFIEKSITAGFDLINVQPLKSMADLGKFIFKEFKAAG